MAVLLLLTRQQMGLQEQVSYTFGESCNICHDLNSQVQNFTSAALQRSGKLDQLSSNRKKTDSNYIDGKVARNVQPSSIFYSMSSAHKLSTYIPHAKYICLLSELPKSQPISSVVWSLAVHHVGQREAPWCSSLKTIYLKTLLCRE